MIPEDEGRRLFGSGFVPDWSGIWVLYFPKPGDAPPEQPSLTPTAAAELKMLQAKEAKNQEPPTECQRRAAGDAANHVSAVRCRISFHAGRVTIIQEAYMQVRRVFTDGRGHPAGLDPTFNGDSIGHWEGDTLVIERPASAIGCPSATTA